MNPKAFNVFMLQSGIQEVSDETNKMSNSKKVGFVYETMNYTQQISITYFGLDNQISIC